MKKRCLKCGAVRDYRPRERRCKAIVVGVWNKERTYCWGHLARVVPQKRVQKPKPEPVVGTPQAKAVAQQAAIAKRMERVQRAFNRYVGNLRRYGNVKWAKLAGEAAQQLKNWERKMRYYEKRARMTDAEVAAERERLQQARAPKPKRAIKVNGPV
jgi:hypothetical protein